MQKQLTLDLFDPPFIESANNLLHELNDGRKKDFFDAVKIYQHGDLYIMTAENKESGIFCNVVDVNGKTPVGFSANWRRKAHILDDIKVSV